jgi:beta-lactamase regulating signal transducer with metallopeptidase domain
MPEFDDPGPLVTPADWHNTGDLFTNVPRRAIPVMARYLQPSDRLARSIEPFLPGLLLLWIIGVSALLFRAVGGWLLLRHVIRHSATPLQAQWHRFRRLSRAFGIKRRITFLETTFVNVPATIGWLRPIIFLPASAITGLAPAHLEALVAHELAHIRRVDYLVNALQTLVEVMLFYHPAVWSLTKIIRDEREQCCDRAAAVALGNDVEYVRALLAVAELRVPRHQLALSAAGSFLSHRISHLLFDKRQPLTRARGAAAGAMVLVASLALFLASQAIGAAMRPLRGPSQIQSLPDSIYKIMGAPRSNESILPVLERFLRTPRNPACMSDIAAALSHGSNPRELTDLMAAATDVTDPHPYSSLRGIKSYLVQRRLIDALIKQATTLRVSNRAAAKDHARAAILLVAQQSSFVGPAPLAAMLGDRAFMNAADLTRRQTTRLVRLVDDHRRVMEICGVWELRAEKSLSRTPIEISEVIDVLNVLAEIAKERPDVQLKLAHIALRLRLAAPDSLSTLTAQSKKWSDVVSSPHFDRWILKACEPATVQATNGLRQPIAAPLLRTLPTARPPMNVGNGR